MLLLCGLSVCLRLQAYKCFGAGAAGEHCDPDIPLDISNREVQQYQLQYVAGLQKQGYHGVAWDNFVTVRTTAVLLRVVSDSLSVFLFPSSFSVLLFSLPLISFSRPGDCLLDYALVAETSTRPWSCVLAFYMPPPHHAVYASR